MFFKVVDYYVLTFLTGKLCVAKFSDDQWYRCKILYMKSKSDAFVRFIDYGNEEVRFSLFFLETFIAVMLYRFKKVLHILKQRFKFL